jgi:hypothetical protein
MFQLLFVYLNFESKNIASDKISFQITVFMDHANKSTIDTTVLSTLEYNLIA